MYIDAYSPWQYTQTHTHARTSIDIVIIFLAWPRINAAQLAHWLHDPLPWIWTSSNASFARFAVLSLARSFAATTDLVTRLGGNDRYYTPRNPPSRNSIPTTLKSQAAAELKPRAAPSLPITSVTTLSRSTPPPTRRRRSLAHSLYVRYTVCT